MTINKPDEIEKMMKEGQFKYVELVSRDKRYGGYNVNPSTLKDKINQIKKFLISLPDDLYYLNFRINQKGDTFQYTFNKGNKPMSESPSMPILYSNTLEKFQTLEEWKKQEQRINELEKELELMKLKEQFKGLNEAPAKEPEKNALIGFAENVLPTFVPFLDKYFQLKEKELNLKERQKAPVVTAQKFIKKFRPVPDLTDPNFQNYLNYFEGLPDQAAEAEVQFLQLNKPDIYKLIIDTMYESE
jgi:hypothetical protein